MCLIQKKKYEGQSEELTERGSGFPINILCTYASIPGLFFHSGSVSETPVCHRYWLTVIFFRFCCCNFLPFFPLNCTLVFYCFTVAHTELFAHNFFLCDLLVENCYNYFFIFLNFDAYRVGSRHKHSIVV